MQTRDTSLLGIGVVKMLGKRWKVLEHIIKNDDRKINDLENVPKILSFEKQKVSEEKEHCGNRESQNSYVRSDTTEIMIYALNIL